MKKIKVIILNIIIIIILNLFSPIISKSNEIRNDIPENTIINNTITNNTINENKQTNIVVENDINNQSDNNCIDAETINNSISENKNNENINLLNSQTEDKKMGIKYSSHVQDVGWQKEVINGEISGTTGKNKKIEAIKISLVNAPDNVSLKYRTYLENSGWQSWVNQGEVSGTTGQNRKIYGIRIKLEGTYNYSIQYRAHIQDIGWSSWKKDGEIVGDIASNKKIEAIQIRVIEAENAARKSLGVEYYTYLEGSSNNENKIEYDDDISGTTGENRKMEGIEIQLINAPSNAHIKYKTHVQDKGWLEWVKDGGLSGIINKGLKIEAIQIELENMSEYTVEYQVHVQDEGWTGWYIDGEMAGTTGQNKKIEAIKIQIVSKKTKKMTVTYKSYIQDLGWESEKKETEQTGTTGKNKKIEAIKISLVNAPDNVSLKYRTYLENSGWQSWVNQGEVSGTTGQNRKIYGIRIKLEGTYNYSIQYRAHIQDIGWSSWKKDGEIVGDIASNKKIEAIQIRVIEAENAARKSLGVEYYTYLEGSSNNENKIEYDDDISGTTGENRKMEGIEIQLINAPSNAHIKYKTHVQDKGWLEWVKDGGLSGIINKGLKIEAIQIELENMSEYTVEYQVHVQDKGWTGWYIDGETAGTTGQNKKIEAIKIKIVPKYKRYYSGIDVSQWQQTINFNELIKSKKVDFMIARIGWYSESKKILNVDTQFERNYREAKNKKLPIGAYFYSYATSVDEAIREAENVVDYLKRTGQTNYELPIFYDIEDKCQIGLSKNTITQMSITFCEILKKAGFKVGVYSYSYWLTNYMDLSKLPNDYAIWVANYGTNNNANLPSDIYKYYNTHDIWQYTSKGNVPGINTEVDMNICYRKYF